MNPFDPDGNDDMVVAVIRRARHLVERGWCQCSFARAGVSHRSVDPRDPDATHFCLDGALARAAYEVTCAYSDRRRDGLRGWLHDHAIIRVRAVLNLASLTCYNDRLGRLQTEILELLDRAAGEK